MTTLPTAPPRNGYAAPWDARVGCVTTTSERESRRTIHSPRLTRAADHIELNDWPPPRAAIVPRIRIGKRWINVLWVLPIGAAVPIVMIAVAQAPRDIPAIEAFIQRYPGVPRS
jgi:hypothetical protein